MNKRQYVIYQEESKLQESGVPDILDTGRSCLRDLRRDLDNSYYNVKALVDMMGEVTAPGKDIGPDFYEALKVWKEMVKPLDVGTKMINQTHDVLDRLEKDGLVR